MAISTGVQNKAAISAISMLDRREILKKAVDIQNEEGLTDILQLAGKMVETKQPVYHDFAEDPLYQLLDTTGATVTGSGTAQVTTTLTAGTSGFVVVGDLIVFPNDLVGQVTSVTPSAGQDTIIIKSVKASETLTHTAGQKLAPFSNVVGEASDKPTNRKYGWTKYLNLVQQFRGFNSITDIQHISDIEIEYEGQNYVFNRDIANKFIKFKADINAAFILGRQSATQYSDASPAFVDPVGGGAQQTTMGLNQYATTYGVVGSVATPGTVILSDFETYFNLLIAARAPLKYTGLGASKALAKVSNCLKNLGSSASIASARLNVDGKELDFDVEKFSYMGFTVQFGVMPIMNHPVLMSQTAAVKNIFMLPEGKVPTKDGALVDRISARYMKNPIKGFGNDIYAEWDTGAMARGGANSSKAVRETHWLSTQGLHIVGAAQLGKWQVLA